MFVRVCSKCGGVNVHRSRRRGLLEYFYSLALMRPYRCFDCNTRFFTFRFAHSMASPDVKRRHRHEHRDEEVPAK